MTIVDLILFCLSTFIAFLISFCFYRKSKKYEEDRFFKTNEFKKLKGAVDTKYSVIENMAKSLIDCNKDDFGAKNEELKSNTNRYINSVNDLYNASKDSMLVDEYNKNIKNIVKLSERDNSVLVEKVEFKYESKDNICQWIKILEEAKLSYTDVIKKLEKE